MLWQLSQNTAICFDSLKHGKKKQRAKTLRDHMKLKKNIIILLDSVPELKTK